MESYGRGARGTALERRRIELLARRWRIAGALEIILEESRQESSIRYRVLAQLFQLSGRIVVGDLADWLRCCTASLTRIFRHIHLVTEALLLVFRGSAN